MVSQLWCCWSVKPSGVWHCHWVSGFLCSRGTTISQNVGTSHPATQSHPRGLEYSYSNLCNFSSSSSSSGPGAYAPDALQPLSLLCDPCPPMIYRHSHFRCQVPPRPYNVRDPSSERWNCGWECWPVILPKCRLTRFI